MKLRTLTIELASGHRYLFCWKDAPDLPALYAALGDLAADPELPDFTWQTALQVVQLIAVRVYG